MLAVSALATSIGGGTVNASHLNVRLASDTSSSILTAAPQGTTVIVTEESNDWYKIMYKGIEGYVHSDYLSFSKILDGGFGTGVVSADAVRMRQCAALDSPVLNFFCNGAEIPIAGVSGEWYKVDVNGIIGYIHSDYIIPSSAMSSAYSQTANAACVSVGQTIVDTAMKYLGTPYVWAGTSTKGFDCSGFVYYVFKECGYSINRTAATIYGDGEHVDKSELQVGDVICFTTSSNWGIGHVGIYIGNDQFIHSSSAQGGVIITDLYTSYYTLHYYGARRIA